MAPILQLALASLLLPVAAAALIGLVPRLRRSGGAAAIVSLVAAVASLGSAAAALLSFHRTAVVRIPWLPMGGKVLAEVGLQVDGTSAIMGVVVAFVATMVQLYSVGYLEKDPPPHVGRYYAYQSLFLFSMQGLVYSQGLLQLFCFWELVGLCSYLLIGYYFAKPSAGKAAVKAFWVNKLGDMGFLVALILIFLAFGTFDLQGLVAQVKGGAAVATAIPLLLFAGVMSKSAQVPLHVWLPDAMEGPTPVSALLHAATMVAAGVFLLVRTWFLFEPVPLAQTVVMYVGAITAVFAAVQGTVQDDVKKVLAYSTCSQLGLMVCAIGAGGVGAGYFHLFTHAFFKALLFLAAGSIIHAAHTNSLERMGGLLKNMRWTGGMFAVGVLALAGIWPFAGYFSKDRILEALHGHPVALVLAMSTAFLTPYYMGRAFCLAFLGRPRSEGAERGHEPPTPMMVPMMVLALLTPAVGFFASRFFGITGLPDAGGHFSATAAIALALALGGLASAWLLHGRAPPVPAAAPETALQQIAGGAALPVPVPVPAAGASGLKALLLAGYLDRSYEALYRHVLLAISRAVGFVDRYVVDGFVNVLGWAALQGGAKLRTMQTGVAPDYVFVVALAFAALAAWGVFSVGG